MKQIPIHATISFCASALLLLFPTTRVTASPPADDTVQLRVATERDYVLRKGPREIILEVEVKARQPERGARSPVNVSVVLDRSGSMAGAKVEKARQAACVALDRLESDDYFSLVMYDNRAEVLIEPERAGGREHREELKRRINRIETGGGTALYAGVELGAKQVRTFIDKERVNRVILLSDGIANVGPSKTQDLTALGRKLRDGGLSVTTIGLGDDFNEDLMTGLAEASHANYYYVQDAEKLPGIFAEELGAAGTRVAGDVRIRIEVPEGVKVREVVGHPEITCAEQKTEIVVPELFGAEHRLFHLRCALDEITSDTKPLANVALAYEESATHQHQEQNQRAEIHLTDDPKQAEASVRDEVARNYAVVQNRVDKETAVRLADAGRAKDAAELLRSRAAGNSSAAPQQQLPGIAEENRKLEQLADELSRTGTLGNQSRKSAQWDNYQDKYQKKSQ